MKTENNNTNIYGYCDKFPSLEIGVIRILNEQIEFEGVKTTIKEFIENKIIGCINPIVKDKKFFYSYPNFVDANLLTYTGISYAEYLISIDFSEKTIEDLE